ncbi:MAG: methionyl-tRNA formyltransferase [Patescibacteria group bacterium]
MKKLSLAYFGSPDFAADFLEKILLDKNLPVEVKLVITQPDQKVGRKQTLTPTPVKIIAEKYNIKSQIINNKSQINPKSQIQNFKRLEFRNSNLFGACNLEFSALRIIDLALVYAYGDLLPKELLSLPKYGFWNIHPSLLPKYRGPSPIATPLINGDKITGVTIIKMDEEIDHGPIIAQENLTIKDTDYRPDLEKKLTDLGFEMFKKTVFIKDSLQLKPQNHREATFTKKLSKNDGFIEISKLKNQISKNSKELFNLFRGLTPWPGVWTLVKINELEKRLKITNLTMKQLNNLTVESVQLEGKTEVDFVTFNKAYKIF